MQNSVILLFDPGNAEIINGYNNIFYHLQYLHDVIYVQGGSSVVLTCPLDLKISVDLVG